MSKTDKTYAEILTEEEKEQLYNSQKRLLYKVLAKYKHIGRTVYYEWTEEEIMGELNLIFVENLHRFKPSKNTRFITYTYPTYSMFLRRRMNRIKHNVVYPYGVTKDLTMFLPHYLTLSEEEFLKKVDEFIEEGKITEYRAKACVHNLLSRGSSLDISLETKEGEGLQLIETIHKGVEQKEQETGAYGRTPDFFFDFIQLPTPYIYWLSLLVQGYTVKDLNERFKMRSSTFHKNHVKKKPKDILLRMWSGEKVDFEEEEKKAFETIKRSSNLSMTKIKEICSEVYTNKNFFDFIYE